MNVIDKIINVFSPEKAVKREIARHQLEYITSREKFAAAKSGPSTGEWNPSIPSVNSLLANSWNTVTGRTLALVRDFPGFNNALNAEETHVIGDGIKYRSLVRDSSGELMTKANDVIENAFNDWAESLDGFDLAKKINFFEAQSLTQRNEGEFGEFIVERRAVRDRSRKIPIAYKIIAPNRLIGTGTESTSLMNFNGIDFDPTTMQNLGYNFSDDDYNYLASSAPTYVPAKNIIHGFKAFQPDQMRGITPFTSVVLLAQRYQDFFESEIDIQRMGAKWLAFVTTPSAYGDYKATQQSVDYDNFMKSFKENLSYMMIERLPPGSDVKINNAQRNTSSLLDFHTISIRLISKALELPAELVDNDYSAMRYTNARLSRNDFSTALKVKQRRKIMKFCKPVFRDWFMAGVANGSLSIPGFSSSQVLSKIDRYLRGMWIPQGIPDIDPYKEGKIAMELIEANLYSPKEYATSKGRDLDKIIQDKSEFQDLLEVNNIQQFEKDQSPANTNEEALMQSGSKK